MPSTPYGQPVGDTVTAHTPPHTRAAYAFSSPLRGLTGGTLRPPLWVKLTETVRGA